MCVGIAYAGRPQNDPYCVRWDVKPYSLTYACHYGIFIIFYYYFFSLCHDLNVTFCCALLDT